MKGTLVDNVSNIIKTEYRRQAYFNIEYEVKPIYNTLHKPAEMVEPFVSSIPPDVSMAEALNTMYQSVTQKPSNSLAYAVGVMLETVISSGVKLFAEDIEIPSSQELIKILDLKEESDC